MYKVYIIEISAQCNINNIKVHQSSGFNMQHRYTYLRTSVGIEKRACLTSYID